MAISAFKRQKSIVVLVTVVLLCMLWSGVNAQTGVSMSFLKKDSEVQVEEFASNVLRIVNNTTKQHELSLMVNPPAGWGLMGKSTRDFFILPKDTLIVPVRLRPAGNIKGDMTYVTNAFLTSGGFTIANVSWNIEIQKRSNWNAKLSSNQIYFTEESDSTTFSLHLSNNGNADEAMIVHAFAEPGVKLIDNKGKPVNDRRKPLLLRVNQDTTLLFNIMREAIDLMPDEAEESSVLRYRVKVKVVNERQKRNSKGGWSGNVNLLKLPNERKVQESVFPSFPLTVEWNSFNVLNENTYGSLGLYGYKSLSNSRYFSYYYQASFIQNEVDWAALTGDYLYLGYFSPDYTIEIGDITSGRSGSLLVGSGAKATYTYKKHQVGAVYIGNPSPFEDPFLTGYGAEYKYVNNKLKGQVYYETTDNSLRDIQASHAIADVSYRVNTQHVVNVGGGYSNEDYTGVGVLGITGYRGRLGYQGMIKKFRLNLNGEYHSESYAPRRGIINAMTVVDYPFNETTNFRGGASYYRYQPSDVLSDGSVIDTLDNGQTTVFVQMLKRNGRQSYGIQPRYTMFQSNELDANTGGVNFDYRTRLNHNVSLFSNIFAGQTSFPGNTDVDPIFISNIRFALRYKRLNTNFRYYYGPFYLNEQLIYINSQENPQRFFAMVNHDYWFANKQMRLNLNFNYNYRTVQGRHQLVARPELFYHSKSRVRFSVYANYLLYANAEYERSSSTVNNSPVRDTDYLVPADVSKRIEFGFGIKFNINVPAGMDRNYRASIVVFRDLNGNGMKDRNEQGSENMLIRVTSVSENFTEDNLMLQQDIYELITDYNGEVEYRHLPKGNYRIEVIPLVSNDGWFSGREFYKYIDGNQVVNIPLSRGARLSGGIFVQRDVHTNDEVVSIGGIRVTAVNQSTGESHSSLTDQYGNYSLHLPNGDYIVTINEGAVGSRYQFLENNIPLSVKNSNENYNIGFFLVEKQRTINFGTRRGANAILRTANFKDNRDVTGSDESDLINISLPEAIGKGQVIQLFNEERERLKRTELDTLSAQMSIHCVETTNGKYLYVTNGSSKKGAVKKLLKKIKILGFNEAAIVDVNDLPVAAQVVTGEKPDEAAEQPVSSNKRFEAISSAADKALYRIQFESTVILYEPADFEESLPGIDVINTIQIGDVIYYSVGAFQTEKEAKKYLKTFKKKFNTTEAVIKQYVDEE